MQIRGRAEVRFEQRWMDYYHVLSEGTPAVVGGTKPRPPDRREAIESAFRRHDPRDWRALNVVLDGVWDEDAPHWRRRLKTVLDSLSASAQRAFAKLVEAGCQPDMLAFQFHEATQVEQYEKDHGHLRAELVELDKLGRQAVEAVGTLVSRRTQFDEYLMFRRLSVIEGEPGDAELKILALDLGDLVARHAADNKRMRRQLDARRNPLLGHAEVRLSIRVHASTGAYHDAKVEQILEELRLGKGHTTRAPGTLKKRRQRWTRQIGRGAPGPSE